MNDKPSCVVVGTGSIGRRHLQVLQKGGVNAFAFPARPERLQEMRAANIPTVENWNQVKAQGIKRAVIATDTRRHMEDTLAALDAGCDVLVEKPMTADSAPALQLCESAKRSQRNLWVGCCLRFQESLNTFREQLHLIGRIHSVRIECQSYLPDWRPQRPYRDSYSARPDEGGVLRDLIHELDYTGWLFDWPRKVIANVRTTRRLNIESEDAVDLLMETPEGVAVSICLDYLTRPARRMMRAHGEFGALEWDAIDARVKLEIAGENPREIKSAQTRDEMYLAQDMAFMNVTSNDFDARLASGADGARALAICDAARLASKTRTEAHVDYKALL